MLRARTAIAIATAAAMVALPHAAAACGGCFHQKDDAPSVVTDHRMALAVSKTQTVLWDQVRYQGEPKEFAWVLPVGPGARVELARDEFLSALDVATAPLISAPDFVCPNGQRPNGSSGGGCGGSFGSPSYSDPYDYGGGDAGGFQSTGDVTVVSQSVVGPYVAVIIQSSSGDAISKWLDDNGFEIPASIVPTLASYVAQKLDFLALRLRPDVGVRAMQPVRVITPGADPTLPLRMVAAGTGSNVGLLLYVIGEGRYEATSQPNAIIPLDRLTWNASTARSNYTELFTESIAGGRWVTEYAGRSFGSIKYAYEAVCAKQPPVKVAVPCATDGGADGSAADAGDPDASADAGDPDASDPDATTDASDLDATAADGSAADASDGAAPGCYVLKPACSFFDDDDVATTGMNPNDIVVTRMRTSLPTQGLVDLRLGASGGGMIASHLQAAKFVVAPTCPNAPQSSGSGGCSCDSTGNDRVALFPAALAAVALALLRRRRR